MWATIIVYFFWGLGSLIYADSTFSIVSENEDINVISNLYISRNSSEQNTIIQFKSNLTFTCHENIFDHQTQKFTILI